MSSLQFQSLFGVAAFVGLAWILSERRRAVGWRVVIAGLALQLALVLLLLKLPASRALFASVNDAIAALDRATQTGTAFVFGFLGGGPLPYAETAPGASFVLAFRALPLVLVIGALSSLLYHWGVLQWLVRGFSWLLRKTMNVGGAVGLSSAANVFVGMVEAPMVVQPYLAGMSRKNDLARLDMHAILRSLVPHALLSRIEALAPQRMEVPSGGHYRIDYDTDGDPVLRVRLQEMFGLHAAPQVAEGRARLRIELLSPAGRPVAVTQSLETFWTNAYADVRKDMRGRYPKHYWPENPLEAQAVAPRRLR